MNASGIADTHKAFALRLRIRDLTIAVPPTLSAITTYVLLEQEEWFEKEIRFLRCFLKPGMTAIDIGANLGVYSLPMARLVGPGGRVFSYEPGTEARALLEQSRALNDLGNLEIIGTALSDSAREGNLAFAASSELRALGTSGAGEPVRITSLDMEGAVRGWPSIDFIKIDAEGEEERIIAGGRAFFAAHSPLVMFEIKAGNTVNEKLRALFPTIGYRLFRQLEGAPILVPQDAAQSLDEYELNLFAVKPDRVSALAQQGLLVDAIPAWVPSDHDRKNAVSFWRRQRFASATSPSGGDPHIRGSRVPRLSRGLCDMACHGSAGRDALRGARLRVAKPWRGVRTRVHGRARVELGTARVGMGCAPGKHRRLGAASATPPEHAGSARGAVLAGELAVRRPCPESPAGGVVCRGGSRAVRANLEFLVFLQRRLPGPCLALRAALRQRGNGTSAHPRCCPRRLATGGAEAALHRSARPPERGDLALGNGSRDNGCGVTTPNHPGPRRAKLRRYRAQCSRSG